MLTGKEEAYFARAECKRLQAVNDELLAALKQIRAWILDTGEPITRRDLWNTEFLKSYDLATAAIKKAETK